MATLSDRPAATTLTGAEAFPVRQGSADAKVTTQQVAEIGAEVLEITASATLAITHTGKFINCDHATVAISVTVPPDSSVAFPVNTEIHIRQKGDASVTVAAGVGVTINKPASQTSTVKEKYGVVTLKKMAADTWALFGMLGTA